MSFPASIELHPFNHPKDFVKSNCIPISTWLFREDTAIERALMLAGQAWQDRGSNSPFRVEVPAGSYGLEADTIVAAVTKWMPELGSIALTSYDPVDEATQTAREGRYLLASRTAEELDVERKLLEDFGFETLEGEHDDCWPDDPPIVVSSAKLRAGHDVAFKTSDYLDVGDETPAPDLITCNNLLYHLLNTQGYEGAEAMAMNVANRVVPGGIVSFEGSHSAGMRHHTYEQIMRYIEWRTFLIAKLAVDAGVWPVDIDDYGSQIFKKVTA